MHGRVDPVDVAGGVLRQDHLVREAPAAQLDHGVGPGLERRLEVDAEAVHAEDEAGLGELG